MNERIFRALFNLAHENAILDALIVFFAEYLPYLLLAGAVWFLFAHFRGWRARLLFFVELILAVMVSRGIITEAIRFFVPVARPFLELKLEPLVMESTSAFPSGHAATFFALAMILFYARPKIGAWFFALAFVNGLARVASGVHWPFDVLGGAGVALVSAVLVHALLRPYVEELAARG